MKFPTKPVIIFCCLIFGTHVVYADSEVVPQTATKVIVREHPKTGQPYVSIIRSGEENSVNPLGPLHPGKRPDYRLLDPKIKSGKISYEGPYSDRKKVYAFAAGLATLGTAGAVAGTALIPAAATGASSGGAGVFLAGGSAVVAGTAGAVAVAKTRKDPHRDDFSRTAEANLLESKEMTTKEKNPTNEGSAHSS